MQNARQAVCGLIDELEARVRQDLVSQGRRVLGAAAARNVDFNSRPKERVRGVSGERRECPGALAGSRTEMRVQIRNVR